MKIHPSNRRAFALISIIILVACLLIIAGAIIYMLYKCCKKCLPPPSDGGNHLVEVVNYDTVENFAEAPPIQLPQLRFGELPKPAGWTEQNPFGFAYMELQRCTNLANPVWEVIAVSHEPGQVLSMDDDTNPPPAQAFYRGNFVYP